MNFDRVEIHSTGLLNLIVCAVDDADDDELCRVANRKVLCGTTNGWCSVVRNEHDVCESHPDPSRLLPLRCGEFYGRTHYVIFC